MELSRVRERGRPRDQRAGGPLGRSRGRRRPGDPRWDPHSMNSAELALWDSYSTKLPGYIDSAGGLHNRGLSFAGSKSRPQGPGAAVVVGVLSQQATFNDFDSSGQYRISFVAMKHNGRWRSRIVPSRIARPSGGGAMTTDSRTSFDGRVALVTGASRGIGASCARAFSRAGASVVLAARNELALQRLGRPKSRVPVEPPWWCLPTSVMRGRREIDRANDGAVWSPRYGM